MKYINISLTGHRPHKLGSYDNNSPENLELKARLKDIIVKELLQHEIVTIISGMALGTDTLWALAALELQETFPNRVKLICAVPCLDFSSNWKDSSVKIFDAILSKADEVVYVTNKSFTMNCLQRRNEYMVDKCDMLVAVWNGTSGGTANCIQYAINVRRRRALPILYMSPSSRKTRLTF